MNRMHELQQVGAIAEIDKISANYRQITPRLGFGDGGIDMLERLLGFEERAAAYAIAAEPEDAVVAGWIALETASHFPSGNLRKNYLALAERRFSAVGDLRESEDAMHRFTSIEGRLGLIAVNAYVGPLEKAVEDTPGMYTELLEELLDDIGIRRKYPKMRRGLLGELTVGAVCSSMDLLTIPASVRHDKPVSKDVPSFAHDLQTWNTLPATLPAKPSNYIQVKTSSDNSFKKDYSDAITVVTTDDVFEHSADGIARNLIRYFNGEALSEYGETVITSAQENIRLKLDEPVGTDAYKLSRIPLQRAGGKR